MYSVLVLDGSTANKRRSLYLRIVSDPSETDPTLRGSRTLGAQPCSRLCAVWSVWSLFLLLSLSRLTTQLAIVAWRHLLART